MNLESNAAKPPVDRQKYFHPSCHFISFTYSLQTVITMHWSANFDIAPTVEFPDITTYRWCRDERKPYPRYELDYSYDLEPESYCLSHLKHRVKQFVEPIMV